MVAMLSTSGVVSGGSPVALSRNRSAATRQHAAAEVEVLVLLRRNRAVLADRKEHAAADVDRQRCRRNGTKSRYHKRRTAGVEVDQQRIPAALDRGAVARAARRQPQCFDERCR